MKKLLLIIVFLSLLWASSPVFAGEFRIYTANGSQQLQRLTAPPRAMRIHGEAIELLVDYSGSMSGWINLAKEAIGIILPRLPYNSSVALRVFGERPGTHPEITEVCKATRVVTSFGKQNERAVVKGLAEAKIGGGTPIEFALRETVEKDLKNLRVYDKNRTFKAKKIILVTDGGEGCGGDPCAYIREVMRTRKDISIDVIQLGNDNRLACLADETGGTFHKVNRSSQDFELALEKAFNVPQGTVATRKYMEKSTYKPAPKKPSDRKQLATKYKYVKY